MKRWRVAAGLLVAYACTEGRASAHAIGLSRGEYRLTAEGVSAEMVFDRGELGPAPAARAADLAGRVHVSRGGEPCASTQRPTLAESATTLALRLDFACKMPSERLSIQLSFWDELSAGHRHVVNAPDARASQPLSFASSPNFELTRATARTAPALMPPNPSVAPQAPGWLGWVRYGVEHIWGGLDHLLFLFAVVLGVTEFRSLARITLAFTLAHSATLALATSGAFTLSSELVEPLIALSISYVAVENLLGRQSRARSVFAFGLIHGFGFAGALQEIGLSPWSQPGALVAFNFGVELGQLSLLCVAVPILAWLSRRRGFRQRGALCLNAAIVLVGCVWFSERASTALRTHSDSPSPTGEPALSSESAPPAFRRAVPT